MGFIFGFLPRALVVLSFVGFACESVLAGENADVSVVPDKEMSLFADSRNRVEIKVFKTNNADHPVKAAQVNIYNLSGQVAYYCQTDGDGWCSFPEYLVSDPETGLLVTRINIVSKYGTTQRYFKIEPGKRYCYYHYNGWQPSNPPDFECSN